jgi:hypothetical protein
MARSLRQLILFSAVLWVAAASAESEPKPEKGGFPWKRDAQKGPKVFDPTPSPEFENVRKALDALTPEQRKRFQENFMRWSNLSPEEKKALRDREDVRRRIMHQELEMAIQESGLKLDGPRREQFIKRYTEERRKIEDELRKETMEKRKPLVKEMISKLKEEFSGSTTVAAPDPALAPAAAPKR